NFVLNQAADFRMKRLQPQPTQLSDLAWLSDVRESLQPLSDRCPIWVRHGVVESGPTIPHPERHPYCEFSTITEGSVIAFVGGENLQRLATDYFFAGPGVAHWFRGVKYPVRYAAIYFLPSVLIEMGPASDGIRILRRFTARQSIADRHVRPPPALAPRLRRGFAEIISEFDHRGFGYEVRLRTLLLEMLVALLRWEELTGKEMGETGGTTSWRNIDRALTHLREHFSEEIYARDVAAAA